MTDPRGQIRDTGLTVTDVGFGAASIGNLYRPVASSVARSTVDAAWGRGVRYFDVAPHYGLGLAEQRLGQALGDRPRTEFVVSTKVGRLLVPNEARRGSDLAAHGFAVPDLFRRQLDFSASGVRRSLEESLQRLRLDHVDIALVHDPDEHVEQVLAESLPELLRLRAEGTVRAIGVGMNQWQAPLRFVQEADVDVVMLAGRWTLLDRSGEPLLDECARRGVSVFAAAPFNSGLLSNPEPTEDSHFDYRHPDSREVETAKALSSLARDHGITLPQAAINFPFSHPAVTCVVTGPATPEQVDSAVDWVQTLVPEAFWTDAQGLLDRRM